jgi:hypothetical protein
MTKVLLSVFKLHCHESIYKINVTQIGMHTVQFTGVPQSFSWDCFLKKVVVRTIGETIILIYPLLLLSQKVLHIKQNSIFVKFYVIYLSSQDIY